MTTYNPTTRLFYVVDSVESNEELFETYGEAQSFYDELIYDNHELPRIRICAVNNAYQEHDGGRMFWNYNERNDTFTDIKTIL